MRDEIVGLESLGPVLDGRSVPYVNLDNAATTPPLRTVVEAVEDFVPMASSVHRGSGYKSRVSTAAFEQARDVVGDLVGADADRDVVIFTKNTTEAINRFARTMTMPDDAVVLTTVLEHHSNLLPWRRRGAGRAHPRPPGRVRGRRGPRHRLARHAGRVALLAVTGASNVTGVVPAVHRMAEKVHAVGGKILVDAAQLAGHRGVDMRAHSDAGHLDAVALSAHKMYAPYGAGALIAGRDCLGADPDECGGGTVRAVTLDTVVWADLPDRAEAGSPNLLGVVAFAAAARRLRQIGMTSIAAHEQALAAHLRRQLGALGGVTIAGPACSELGVVSFGIDGVDHRLVAAILGYEHGIGVRSGCFCAQPYVHHLLQLSPGDIARWVALATRGDMRQAPGLVRISLGGYSSSDDVNRAVNGLRQIIAGEIEGSYGQRPDGSFAPVRTPRTRHLATPRGPAPAHSHSVSPAHHSSSRRPLPPESVRSRPE